MRWGERGIKGLNAQAGGVFGKPLLAHDRDGAEATDVSVMQNAPIAEREGDSRVAALGVGKGAIIEQQSTGETRLNDDSIAGREVDHDQLCASPAALDRRA